MNPFLQIEQSEMNFVMQIEESTVDKSEIQVQKKLYMEKSESGIEDVYVQLGIPKNW